MRDAYERLPEQKNWPLRPSELQSIGNDPLLLHPTNMPALKNFDYGIRCNFRVITIEVGLACETSTNRNLRSSPRAIAEITQDQAPASLVHLHTVLFSFFGGQVPRRSESLMGQTLQAPLHVEASAQTAMAVHREPEPGFHGPETVSVGGFAPLPHGLSRASRTRSASVCCI